MSTHTAASRATFVLLLALTLPVLVGAQAGAQTGSLVPRDTRVRFELADGARHEGRVISLDRDTLHTIRPGGTETAHPTATLHKLEIMTGRHRHVLGGLMIGAGAGIIAGGILGASSYSPCNSEGMFGCLLAPGSRMESTALGAVVLGIPGLVIGGALGMIPRDRWERFPTAGAVSRIDARPLRDGAYGVGLGVAF